MFMTMNKSFKTANFTALFLYLRYANGMHWKASIATVTAITHTKEG